MPRSSTFQRIDVELSRLAETKYDTIKLVADNLDAVTAIDEAITAGTLDEVVDVLQEPLKSNIGTVAGIQQEIQDVASIDPADIVAVSSVALDMPTVAAIDTAIQDVADAINDGTIGSVLDKANEILAAREAMKEPTGFNHEIPDELGVMELAVVESPASTYTVYKINENNVGSKLTAQTTWGNGDVIDTANPYQFSIYPVDAVTPVSWWLSGTKYTSTVRQTVVPTTASGMHYFYMDVDGLQYTLSASPSIFRNYAVCSVVYGNAGTGEKVVFANERHGIRMDGTTHVYLHETRGTQYVNGLDIDGVTLGGTAYTNVGTGRINDEDIEITVPLTANSSFLYIDGTVWRGIHDANNIAYTSGGTTYWNKKAVDDTYSLEPIGNNNYALVHFIATNDSEYPIMKVLGQNEYTTKSAAEAGALDEINTLVLDGLPSLEFVFLYTVIVDSDGQVKDLEDGSLYADWRSTGVSLGGGAGSGAATINTVPVTLTAGQTEIAATYTIGLVEVYYNGSKLIPGDDFTADNGTSITLTTPATTTGDIAEVVVYSSFNVADTYTRQEVDTKIDDRFTNVTQATPTLSGNATVVETNQLAITITNYDAEATYEISSITTATEVSIVGDTITILADSVTADTAGEVRVVARKTGYLTSAEAIFSFTVLNITIQNDLDYAINVSGATFNATNYPTIEGAYLDSNITVDLSAERTHDIFEDGSAVATYQLDDAFTNNASGENAVDLGGTYTGTAYNVTNGTGKFGQAGVFNGSSSYIESTIVDLNAGEKTLSCWFKANDTTTLQALVSLEDDSSTFHGSSLLISANEIFVQTRDGANAAKSVSTSFSDTTNWHYLVGIIRNGEAELYLDGTFINNVTFTGNGNDGDRLRIGAMSDDSITYYFNGSIDQVRIFNRALTAQEVTDLYNEDSYYIEATATSAVVDKSTIPEDAEGNWVGSQGTDDIFSSADATNLTITSDIPNTSIYVTDGVSNKAWVDTGTLTDNGNGTWSFAHGLAFTPTTAIYAPSYAISQLPNRLTEGLLGDELVVDGSGNWVGDFDIQADVDEWSVQSTEIITLSGQAMRIQRNNASGYTALLVDTIIGREYQFSVDVTLITEGTVFTLIGSSLYAFDIDNSQLALGDNTVSFTATSTQTSIGVALSGTATADITVDNISVKQLDVSANSTEILVQDQVTDGDVLYVGDASNIDEVQADASVKYYDPSDTSDPNLVALYEANGNANDSTTTYNGTPTNITYTSGVIGQAFSFNGTSSKIDTASSLSIGSGDFYISLFFRANPQSSQNYLLKQGEESSGRWFGISVDNITGKIDCNIDDGTTNSAIESTITVEDFTWRHMIFEREGSTLRLYINNQIDVENTSATVNTVFEDSPLGIGYNKAAANRYFDGDIDQIVIANGTTTQTKRDELYNVGKSKLAHNQAYTPTFALTKDNVNIDLSADATNFETMVKGSAPELNQIVQPQVHDVFGDGSAVATYSLDGNANDLGGSYNGTASNVTYGTGKFGQAGVFSSSKISMSTDWTPANLKTVSLWIKPSTTDYNTAFSVGKYPSSNGYPWLILGHDPSVADGSIRAGYTSSIGSTLRGVRSSEPVTLNTWTHIVLVVDGDYSASGDAKLYINGQQDVGTILSDGSPNTITGDACIGQYSARDISPFSGSIDQVRIFDRALTATEVEALYLEDVVKVKEVFNELTLANTGTQLQHKAKAKEADTIIEDIQIGLREEI